jgi:hypothetical protein
MILEIVSRLTSVPGSIPVSGHVDFNGPDLGDHRLGPRTVPRVTTVTALDRVLLIAEILVHLALQPGLEHLFRELTQQPVQADEIDPIGPGLFDQPLSDQPIDRRRQLQLRPGLDALVVNLVL